MVEDLTGSSVGRFAIRSLLGSGGMGEVYCADDTKLKRAVALKRLTRKLRSDERSRERILKEAQRASALKSPHIASIYDVLEENDEVFLVMEYVEGKTLRQHLRARGALPLDQFLDLAVQCAEALSSAHQTGIIHRDIKPENIMLTPAGQVKILDFGLAKRLPLVDESAVTASLESRAGIAGTPGYMAPEVLLERELDARSDIFSLGVVFYEMLAGRHPFHTDKVIVTADRILHEPPPSLRQLVPDLPPDLERMVSKMLAKDPAERYATAADLLVDLRALQRGVFRPLALPTPARLRKWAKRAARITAMTLLVLLLLSVLPGARQQWKRWFAGVELPEKKNLAVLPFVPVNSDANSRAFSQGLTETLTAKLTQLTDKYPLQVVPPSEIRVQSITSVEQARVGLGVNLVLEGSLHQSGQMMRVAYSLVDARTRRQLRAATVTTEASDPFAVEDRVVDSVLRSLELELGAGDRRALAARGTTEPAAYDFYLQGRGYLQEYQIPENIDSAITVFNHALERDPKYALAYAGLGEAYWHKYQLNHNADWVKKATDACQRATASAAGHSCLGRVLDSTGQYERAVAEFEQAVRMDPTNDDAHRGLANAYEHLGRIADSEKTYRHAIELRPHYWAGYNWLGTFLFRRARYEEAVTMFSQVTMLAPDSFRGYNNLGAAYVAMGRYADAIPALQRSVAIRPMPDSYSNLGTAFFYQRRYGEAAAAYRQAIQLGYGLYQIWGNLGDALYWGGQRQQAAEEYRKALVKVSDHLGVNPRDATALSYLALYNAMLGARKAAVTARDKSVVLARSDPEVLFNAALVSMQVGDSRGAVAWIGESLAAGYSPDLVRTSPNLEELKSDPAFQRLIQTRSR